ncbi:hypothetical protein [Lacinutrix cladophorae]
MNNLYQKFHEDFYLKTGGYIPSIIQNQNLYPGDFFQIKDGQMVVLGNVFRDGIVDKNDCEIESNILLNAANWNFNEGVSKPYSGRTNGENALEGNFEWSKQILAFKSAGSYWFTANNPKSTKLFNWNAIKDALIIKMTQTYYSFRELYVVNECATAEGWSLVVSGNSDAELELATEAENFGLQDLFCHDTTKTISSRNIEYYQREDKRIPQFFKAKKLTVKNEKVEAFIRDLISKQKNKEDWANDFFNQDYYQDPNFVSQKHCVNIASNVLDMLPPNTLNPNTALSYFKWEDANLEDINKLFIRYGSNGNFKNDIQ